MATTVTDAPSYTRDGLRLRLWENGIWRVCWSEGRQTRSLSTGEREFEPARAWLDRYAAGRASATPAPPEVTVGLILDRYVADLEERGKPWASGAGYARKKLRETLGRLRPSDLTTKVMRKWAKAEAAAGVGQGYIRKQVVSVLRPAMKLAKRDGLLDIVPELEAVSAPAPKDRWLSRTEADQLLAGCRSDHIRLFILVALQTGARRGAILSLTWDRVDFDTGLITFALPSRVHDRKRRATVPMSDTLYEALWNARTWAITDHVIEEEGKAPVGDVKHAFNNAARRAGLAGVTPHVLRHTAASWMAMAGVPLDEIADTLSATPATVWRTYRRFRPDYLRRAVAALG